MVVVFLRLYNLERMGKSFVHIQGNWRGNKKKAKHEDGVCNYQILTTKLRLG